MAGKKVSVRVSEELAREFAKIASARQVSKSALLAEAIEEYLEKNKLLWHPDFLVGKREDTSEV